MPTILRWRNVIIDFFRHETILRVGFRRLIVKTPRWLVCWDDLGAVAHKMSHKANVAV